MSSWSPKAQEKQKESAMNVGFYVAFTEGLICDPCPWRFPEILAATHRIDVNLATEDGNPDLPLNPGRARECCIGLIGARCSV